MKWRETITRMVSPGAFMFFGVKKEQLMGKKHAGKYGCFPALLRHASPFSMPRPGNPIGLPPGEACH